MNVATVAPPPGRRPDASRRNARPGFAATDDGEVRAECGERLRRRQPNAIGGTRNQDLLVVHGTAIQGSGHARMICLIIFDCRRGDGVNLSMLSRARHENSPRPCAIKNPGKGSPSPAKAAHFPIVTGEGMLSCPPHANNLVGAAFG